MFNSRLRRFNHFRFATGQIRVDTRIARGQNQEPVEIDTSVQPIGVVRAMSDETFLSHVGPLIETLTVRRWYRSFIAGIWLILGAGVGLLGLLAVRIGAPPGVVSAILMAATALVGVLLVVVFGLQRRHRLYRCEEGFGIRGLGITEFGFADVVNLKWLSQGLGCAVLSTTAGRLKIIFARYEPEATLRIVQDLRRAIPVERQQDWNLFCLRIALPLRSPQNVDRRPDVLFSRAQFDRLCGSLLFVELAFGLGDWLLANNWKSPAVSCAITSIGWYTARFFVPRHSTIRAHWFPLGHMVDFGVDHVAGGMRRLGVILLGVTIAVAVLPKMPGMIGIVFSVLIAIVVIDVLAQFALWQIRFFRDLRVRRDEDLMASASAIQEWDALDGALARGPLEEATAERVTARAS